MKREIRIRPAFDKRDPDPSKNYGIHGAELAFYLSGEKGAVQFVIYTGWHLPHVASEIGVSAPMGADVGYHSKVQLYGGQESIDDNCEFTGGKCYYNGSGLAAESMFKLLVEEGHEAVWNRMEQLYIDQLENPDTDDGA